MKEYSLQVKCLDNCQNAIGLTIGKIYTVNGEIEKEYLIENDNGFKNYYLKNRFEIIKEDKSVKEYKGWEIAKMICEGILKEGDIIIRIDDNQYAKKMIKNKCISEIDDFEERGSSFLTMPDIRFIIEENQ